MPKARQRYFEISPSWAGAAEVGLATEGWALAPLTAGISFETLETRYGDKAPVSGRFMYKKLPKAIPDLVHASGEVPIVTAAFKTAVETLAPGEAEFRPFTMRWPDDEPVAGDWHLMNVLNMVDCFDFDRMGKPRPTPITKRPTGEVMTAEETAWQSRIGQLYSSRPFYISQETAGPLKIWRPLFHSHSIFCTGDLVKALRAAGVKRLHAERLGTREDPIPVIDWAALGVRPPGEPA